MPIVRRARAAFYALLPCLFGFGIALICVGSKALGATSEFHYWLLSLDLSPPILAVVSGSCLVGLVALGFVCAFKEYETGLIIFAGILGAVTVLQIVGGALAAASSAASTAPLQRRMEISMEQYPQEDDDKEAWNRLQSKMKCCGVLNSQEWEEIYTKKTIPSSCCQQKKLPEDDDDAGQSKRRKEFCQPKDRVFRQPCFRVLLANVKTSLDEVAYVCLIFSFIQILVIGLGFYLAFSMKKDRDVKAAVVEVLKEGGESAASRRSSKEMRVATISSATT